MVWKAITTIQSNVGMSIEVIFLLIIIGVSLIFMAKDFKLGVIVGFILNGALFTWTYVVGLNWQPGLVGLLMYGLIMTFTLYYVNQTTRQGAII